MVCVDLIGMALVAALAMLAALASSSLAAVKDDPAKLTVKCDTTGKQRTSVTVAHTTLQVTCPNDKYSVEPAAGKTPETQQVCVDAQCKELKALTSFCPGATGKSSPQSGNSGLILTFPGLPPAPATFYLQCKAPGGAGEQKCVVEVLVKDTPAGGQKQARTGVDGDRKDQEHVNSNNPDSTVSPGGTSNGNAQDVKPDGHDGDALPTPGIQPSPQGGQSGGGGATDAGGTADVRTCEQPNMSITIRLPEKGASAQFACKIGFNLYPSQADKVFSKDCKKQETLKNMTRIPAPAATSGAGTNADKPPPAPAPVVYTLRADDKPPKKTLCYLCAQQGISELQPGKAENYCTIYVESGALKQLDRGLPLALMLPCVLAVLRRM